jgi:ribosomal protein S1
VRRRDTHLSVGAQVSGTVVRHHPTGLEVRLDGTGESGDVDVSAIAPPEQRLRAPEDFPPVGARVDALVLGYSDGRLRLSLMV